jgi:hypothetical protein
MGSGTEQREKALGEVRQDSQIAGPHPPRYEENAQKVETKN